MLEPLRSVRLVNLIITALIWVGILSAALAADIEVTEMPDASEKLVDATYVCTCC
jgi:hypothetical protein